MVPSKLPLESEDSEFHVMKKQKLEKMVNILHYQLEYVDDGYGECYPTVEVGLDLMKEERDFQGKKTFAQTFFTESNSVRRAYRPK